MVAASQVHPTSSQHPRRPRADDGALGHAEFQEGAARRRTAITGPIVVQTIAKHFLASANETDAYRASQVTVGFCQCASLRMLLADDNFGRRRPHAWRRDNDRRPWSNDLFHYKLGS